MKNARNAVALMITALLLYAAIAACGPSAAPESESPTGNDSDNRNAAAPTTASNAAQETINNSNAAAPTTASNAARETADNRNTTAPTAASNAGNQQENPTADAGDQDERQDPPSETNPGTSYREQRKATAAAATAQALAHIPYHQRFSDADYAPYTSINHDISIEPGNPENATIDHTETAVDYPRMYGAITQIAMLRFISDIKQNAPSEVSHPSYITNPFRQSPEEHGYVTIKYVDQHVPVYYMEYIVSFNNGDYWDHKRPYIATKDGTKPVLDNDRIINGPIISYKAKGCPVTRNFKVAAYYRQVAIPTTEDVELADAFHPENYYYDGELLAIKFEPYEPQESKFRDEYPHVCSNNPTPNQEIKNHLRDQKHVLSDFRNFEYTAINLTRWKSDHAQKLCRSSNQDPYANCLICDIHLEAACFENGERSQISLNRREANEAKNYCAAGMPDESDFWNYISDEAAKAICANIAEQQ